MGHIKCAAQTRMSDTREPTDAHYLPPSEEQQALVAPAVPEVADGGKWDQEAQAEAAKGADWKLPEGDEGDEDDSDEDYVPDDESDDDESEEEDEEEEEQEEKA